jgi:hypothetical protein
MVVDKEEVNNITPGDTKKTDEDLFVEYVNLNQTGGYLPTLFENHLAFPNIRARHWKFMRQEILRKNFAGLKRYVQENDLFNNSIVSLDFLDKYDMERQDVGPFSDPIPSTSQMLESSLEEELEDSEANAND